MEALRRNNLKKNMKKGANPRREEASSGSGALYSQRIYEGFCAFIKHRFLLLYTSFSPL
jgi:hypothetical protein